ncbi:MAG: DUF2231 domain-containing protein [Gemmatimonadaceae bacterium]
MLPNPLHPAVVHFPIVLAFLLPAFIGGALWSIRRGRAVRRAWLVPTAIAAALSASAWLSVQTGDAQSERVERIVGDAPLDAHEDMAEVFFTASVAVALITAAGLLGGLPGRTARVLTGVGSLVLVGLVARVGHSGGQLVYRHGAATAYADTAGNAKDRNVLPATTSARDARRRGAVDNQDQ